MFCVFSNVAQAKIDIERLEKIKVPESDSFIQNIFTGEAKVQNFFPYPNVLTQEEFSFVEMITEPAHKIYATEYDPLKVEETGELDQKHLQLLKDMGAFGVMASFITFIVCSYKLNSIFYLIFRCLLSMVNYLKNFTFSIF